MDLPVVASISIATLGLAVGVFELFVYRRRPEERQALWTALVALSAATYSVCMVVLQQVEPGPVARVANQILYVMVVWVVHGLHPLASALTERPLRSAWRLALVGSATVWSGLVLFTPWVVTHTFTEVPLLLLSQPFPQYQVTALSGVFLTYQLVVGGLATTRLLLRPGRGNVAFGGAFGLWVLAGGLDSVVVLRLVDTSPAYFAELGLLGMVLVLGVRTVVDYTRSLEAQQRSFQGMMENAPVLLALYRDGRFVYVNRVGARFLGYSQDELVGRPITDLVQADERVTVSRRVREVAAGVVAATRPARRSLVAADGSTLHAEITSIPVQYEGKPAILALGRDLGEQTRFEARMLELDRMVAVGTLAAGVAHEINNPLTFVSGNLDLLEAALVDAPSEIRAALVDARTGAQRIQRIVGDLSGLSRDERPVLGRVDLVEVVELSLRITDTELRHRAQVERELAAVEPVLVDPRRLGQVVTNLLLNAAHAIPVGRVSENRVTVRTAMRGANVALEVADTGCGIEEHLLEEIFDPFMTTKSPGEGTGLGLAISRQIVETFGGRIEVESEVGVGTTFRVLLPRAPTEAPVKAALRPAEPPAEVPPSRLLIVDDEALVLRVIARVLSRRHQVDAVSSVAEALEILDGGSRYDLVLCDLMMPDQTGMDFHDLVRERYPDQLPRIAYMTGGVFSEEGEAFVSLAEVTVLDKPLDVARVEALLAEVRGRTL